eukprot:1319757-Rhodomonas_salina.2
MEGGRAGRKDGGRRIGEQGSSHIAALLKALPSAFTPQVCGELVQSPKLLGWGQEQRQRAGAQKS